MTGNNTNPSSATTLRRSADQKIFAGVCGGLGEHFGINAWWFRWAFIILAFFGFAGIALYILAWLLIPRADGSESVAGGWFDDLDMSDAGTLFGVVLIGVAALIIATSVFDISGAIVIAAALGVVGYLLYRGDLRPPVKVSVSMDDDDPGPGGPGVPPEDSANDPETDGDPETDDVDMTPAAPAAGAAASVATIPPKTPKPPKAAKPLKPKKPSPPKSMLGRLTMAVMLIVLSSMALVELAGWLHFQPFEYAAAAMAVVAIGLLVGAWVGRAYWLIFIGLLIAPFLFFSSFIPKLADWSVGDPGHQPLSVQDVNSTYDLGIGQLTIDLTKLSAEELAEVGAIKAEVGLGQLVVRLPGEVGATVDAEVGMGAVTGLNAFGSSTFNSYEYSGVGVEQRFELGSPPHELHLDLEVGLGAISIERVGEFEFDAIGSEG